MSKRVPLPVSKAKNAYDLLGDVANAILEEPKRVWMTDWIRRPSQVNDLIVSLRDRAESWNNTGALERLPESGPECGFVGCIAGWTCLLAGETRKKEASAGYTAAKLLGARVKSRNPTHYFDITTQELGWDEFNEALETLFTENFPEDEGMVYGTPEYAKAVAKNIRDFRKRWASRLKATPFKYKKPKASRVGSRKVRVPLAKQPRA